MNYNEQVLETLWQILIDFVSSDIISVQSVIDSGLIVNLVSVLNDDLHKIQPFHAQALDKLIYKADKAGTQRLVALGIVALCVRLLKHPNMHCVGNGIYSLVNLIADTDNRRDKEEHPLAAQIRTYKGDETLLALYSDTHTSREYQSQIALILGAIYQGMPLPKGYTEIAEKIKGLSRTGSLWERKNAILRLRLLASVPGVNIYEDYY